MAAISSFFGLLLLLLLLPASVSLLPLLLLLLLLLLPASVSLLPLLLLPLPLLLLPLPLLIFGSSIAGGLVFVCSSNAGDDLGCSVERGKIVITFGIGLMLLFVSLTVLVVLVVMLDCGWVGGTCLCRRCSIVIHSEGGVWFVAMVRKVRG